MKTLIYVFPNMPDKGSMNTFYQKWENRLFAEVSVCFYYFASAGTLTLRSLWEPVELVFFPRLPPLKFDVPFYPGLIEGRINPCVFCVFESM